LQKFAIFYITDKLHTKFYREW